MSGWWTTIWIAADQPAYPEPGPEPPQPPYDPWTPAVIQSADWTCSCASSAWILNSMGDSRLGRSWNEWDVVGALRTATYEGAVSPAYGLARADMADLQTMFEGLGYMVERKQYLVADDVLGVAGIYPMQVNGARWYHHSGVRELGDGFLYLANPAPSWRGVGTQLDRQEAAQWGSWNMMWIVGRR